MSEQGADDCDRLEERAGKATGRWANAARFLAGLLVSCVVFGGLAFAVPFFGVLALVPFALSSGYAMTGLLGTCLILSVPSMGIHALVCTAFSIRRLWRILRGLEDARAKGFTSAGLKHGCLLSFVTVPVVVILVWMVFSRL